MSVLTCERRGCANVMCDLFSYEYGYICNECFRELVRSGVRTNIVEFMNTEPGSPPPEEEDATLAYFSAIFKDRRPK